MDFSVLSQAFLGFVGVGAAVSCVIVLLKLPAILSKGKIVLLPDGWAGPAQVLINLALFVAFVVTKLFYPAFQFDELDYNLQKYAALIMQVVGFLVQIGASNLSYEKFLKPAAPKAVSYSKAKTFG
jgi:hypothetical protein